MKRFFSTLAIILGIACINVDGVNGDGKPVSATIKADIYKIFRNSCFDCHSTGGRKMAMSHVDFSEWDNYLADKKARKAAEIVSTLQKAKMPPKLYRESHPDAIPTPAQIDSIVTWADSLPKQ